MGMPAASSVLCAGRSPPVMSSMLSESMPTRVGPAPRPAPPRPRPSGTGGRPGRRECRSDAPSRSAPAPHGRERRRAGTPPGRSPARGRPGHPPPRPPGRPVAPGRRPARSSAAGVPVRRRVQIRARVGDHGDAPDLELGPRRVDGPAGLADDRWSVMTGAGSPGYVTRPSRMTCDSSTMRGPSPTRRDRRRTASAMRLGQRSCASDAHLAHHEQSQLPDEQRRDVGVGDVRRPGCPAGIPGPGCRRHC